MRRQLGVDGRVLNVPVAHVDLDGAGIDALVGEIEAAGVTEHVRVHREPYACIVTSPCDDLAHAGRRKWPAPF